MSDTTPATHDRAPEPPALAPVFTPPVFDEPSYTDGRGHITTAAQEPHSGPQDAPAATEATDEPSEGVTDAPAAAPCRSCGALTGHVPACPTLAPAGPVPVLQGTFALFVTPENAIVLAYRPEGATADKQLLVPPFITEMVARQTGHSVSDVLTALGEAL